jgi:hypothetical protein
MQLVTGVLWDLAIMLTPALAVAAVAHVAWRGFSHFQKLFAYGNATNPARQLAWARSWASSFAILINIAVSLIFLGNVYFAAFRIVEHPAPSYEYVTYFGGLGVSGWVLGFAFYLAERRALLRPRGAKDVTI